MTLLLVKNYMGILAVKQAGRLTLVAINWSNGQQSYSRGDRVSQQPIPISIILITTVRRFRKLYLSIH